MPPSYYEIRVTGILPPEALLDFERLKAQLLAEKLFLAKSPKLYAPLRRVANEAAAVAIAALRAHLVLGLQHEVAEKVLHLERQQRPQDQSRFVAHLIPFDLRRTRE